MSLAACALRIATTRILAAALPAPFEVLDSPQDVIPLLESDAPKPFAAVFTGSITTEIEGRQLLCGDSKISLHIQILVPETFAFSLPGGGGLELDTRRQGAETLFDAICRRAELALISCDTNWSVLWNDLVMRTPQKRVSSYLVESAKIRAPAREYTLDCETIAEPVPGAAPSGTWANLLALMRADGSGDGLSIIADWMESEIRGGADLSQADRDRIFLGIAKYAMAPIRLTSPGNVDFIDPVPSTAQGSFDTPADPNNPDAQI